MNIQVVLSNYHNSLYYNKQWHMLAQGGDIDSIVNIGTDFARSKILEYAVACWQYFIDTGYCYYQMEDDINALNFKQSYEIPPNCMVLRNMGNCFINLGKIVQLKDCDYNADMLEYNLTF